MDIIISLNIDPSSNEGLRVSYLSNCLQQLTNLYQIVDSTNYKNVLNDCLASMANFILNNETQNAINEFDTQISSIQTLKEAFFLDYGNWFKNQYTPPI